MSPITTHVLDTSRGAPAAGVPVLLELESSRDKFTRLAQATTDNDGRVKNLLAEDAKLAPGRYRLTFDTAVYFRAHQVKSFYPYIHVVFEIPQHLGHAPGEAAGHTHFHVPLLLSPYGYSTYRGS